MRIESQVDRLKETMLEVSLKRSLKRFSLECSFSLTNGTYGILGASGCGKSMTLKSIAGIITPDSGRITLTQEGSRTVLYDSENGVNLKPQKRNVGYLFQNYALFPNMTVEENILVGLESRKRVLSRDTRKKICADMIEMFQLGDLEKQYPRTLSGGQQQRVAFARILAYNPGILLLDEPFSAMDAFLREGLRIEMLGVLREYEGVTIMVSHDRDEVYQLCDNIILMDNGRIIQIGKKEEVFSRPRTVNAARLTGCKNISRIKKVGERKVIATDWDNLELVTEQAVSDNIDFIGVRAHDFREAAAEACTNLISTDEATILEMPFEWYVNLKNGIRWKKEKSDIVEGKHFPMPGKLWVDPSKILLLESDMQ